MTSRNAFDRWLFETQVEPAFRAHAFLLRAEVLIVPRLWSIEAGRPTPERSALTETWHA